MFTRKGERFVWTSLQEQAFVKLKELGVTAPVLSSPKEEGTYILDTDASDFGLGAVLQQKQDGVVKVIAYASRALNGAEKSYCTTRKELLAIIYGLKSYRQFLLARHFIIRTDHAAFTHLLRTPEPLAQQARWLDSSILRFNIVPVYHIRTSVSRRPCQRNEELNCRQCAWNQITV